MSNDKKDNEILNFRVNKNNRAIGDPPEHFTTEMNMVWCEIQCQLPDGTLKETDYLSFELLCCLVHEYRLTLHNFPADRLEILTNLLIDFKMTPESRINGSD